MLIKRIGLYRLPDPVSVPIKCRCCGKTLKKASQRRHQHELCNRCKK